jgi:biopolymer transport protein ExbD
MAIKRRYKRSLDFSAVSMSDLVFLLLIFFMLTSTLITPSAIKLLLPDSNSRTIEQPPKMTISINEKHEYFLDGIQVDEVTLANQLTTKLNGRDAVSIRLEADKSITIQEIVNIIDVVNTLNAKNKTNHKVILATQPKN